MGKSRNDEGHCVECGKRGCRKHRFNTGESRRVRRKAKEWGREIALRAFTQSEVKEIAER